MGPVAGEEPFAALVSLLCKAGYRSRAPASPTRKSMLFPAPRRPLPGARAVAVPADPCDAYNQGARRPAGSGKGRCWDISIRVSLRPRSSRPRERRGVQRVLHAVRRQLVCVRVPHRGDTAWTRPLGGTRARDARGCLSPLNRPGAAATPALRFPQDVLRTLRKRVKPQVPDGMEVWLWGLGRHMGTACAWSLRFSATGAFREEIRRAQEERCVTLPRRIEVRCLGTGTGCLRSSCCHCDALRSKHFTTRWGHAGGEGDRCWEVDSSGVPKTLEMDDHENMLLVAWLRTGAWLLPAVEGRLEMEELCFRVADRGCGLWSNGLPQSTWEASLDGDLLGGGVPGGAGAEEGAKGAADDLLALKVGLTSARLVRASPLTHAPTHPARLRIATHPRIHPPRTPAHVTPFACHPTHVSRLRIA